MGPWKSLPQIKEVVTELKSFIELIEKHYAKRPIPYTTREFHQRYLRRQLNDESYWIRSLVTPPRILQSDWVIWQYHNRGRRPGIIGPVDLNVARQSFQAITK